MKYLVVYCYEHPKMDGVVTRIVKEGIFDTFEEAETAETDVWDRFEKATSEKRPAYLMTSKIIPLE